MQPDEVITATQGFIGLLQGFQRQHQENIANAQAPVDAATKELTDAQAAVVAAQAKVVQATADAQTTIATESAIVAEDQQAIDAANAIIVQLGGTPVPSL